MCVQVLKDQTYNQISDAKIVLNYRFGALNCIFNMILLLNKNTSIVIFMIFHNNKFNLDQQQYLHFILLSINHVHVGKEFAFQNGGSLVILVL